MKVRIIRQARSGGSDLSAESFRQGQTYDFPADVAQYLIAEGFAEPERRHQPERRRFTGPDRRKFQDVIDEHRNGRKVRS